MSAVAKGSLFPAQLAEEMFTKIKGHSSLARMAAAEPVPFNGKDIFTFDFSSELAVVGENAAKPVGDAAVAGVQIRPVKVVYQSRFSDEFMMASEEYQLQVLGTFADGFAKKIGEGLDIMALHGVNPATGSAASGTIGNNHLDYVIANYSSGANQIVYGHDSTAADYNVEEAIDKIVDPTGIILGGTIRAAIAALTTDNGRKYPEFAWGATPATLGNMRLDSNKTVEANSAKARAYVGDWNSFKWGIAKELPLEVIEFGDPDGAGTDLKNMNQICLRSEAFIGWAFMNAADFARVYVTP